MAGTQSPLGELRLPLLLLAAQCGLALSVTPANHTIVVPLALLPALQRPQVLRLLLRWRLLLFLALMLFGVPLLFGTRSAQLAGISYDPHYLRSSLIMAERSVILLVAIRLFSSRLSLPGLAQAVATTRFRQLGEAFALSSTLLPLFRAAGRAAVDEYRRSGERLRPAGLIASAASLVARLLILAEERTDVPCNRGSDAEHIPGAGDSAVAAAGPMVLCGTGHDCRGYRGGTRVYAGRRGGERPAQSGYPPGDCHGAGPFPDRAAAATHGG